MKTKNLFIFLTLLLTSSALAQSVSISIGSSASDTTEVCNGASVTIALSTTGISNITGYEWTVTDGSSSNNFSTSTITFAPTANGYYSISCTVFGSDTVSASVYANVVTPISNVVISSVGGLSSTTLCYGATSGTLSSAVTGGGVSLNYQWQKKNGTGSWVTVGSNTAQLTDVNGLTETTEYRLKVSSGGEGCSEVTSNTISFSVYSPLVAPVITSAQTICYNTVPSSLTGTAATGGDGSYSYTWEVSTDGNNWSSVSNATGLSYSPSQLTTSTYYRLRVTDGCESVTSNQVLITVYSALTSGTLTALDNQLCYNSSTQLTILGTNGGDGSYTRTWESSVDGLNYSVISGQTATTLTTGNLTVDTYYRVVENSGCNVISTSAPILIDVAEDFTIGNLSYNGSTLLCYNESPSVMSISGSGGRSPYTYQWQSKSSSSSTWNNISGATSSTFTETTPLTLDTDYRVLVSSADGCGTLISNVQSISVRDDLVASSITGNQIICNNTSANLTRGIASGADGIFTYEWQSSTDGLNFTDLNSSATTINTGNLTSNHFYRVKVNNALCGTTKYSSVSLVQVRDPLNAGTISIQDAQICYTSLTTLNSVGVTGADGNYTYQWQYFDTNSSAWTAMGSSTASISTGILSADRGYRLIVNSGCNVEDITPVVNVDVADEFVIGTIQNSGLDTICWNTTPSTLSISGSGGRSPYTYQWQRKLVSGSTWSNVGTSSSSYTESTNQTESVEYRVLLTSQDGCGTLVSGVYTIIVRPDMVPPTVSNDVIICHNTGTVLTRGDASGINGVFTYEWESSSNGTTFTGIGQSGTSLSTGNLTSTTWYRAKSSNSLCSVVKYSGAVRVKVRDTLFAGTISVVDNELCYNTGATLSVSNTSGADTNYTYDWQYNEGGVGWTSFSTGITNVSSPSHQSDVDFRVITNSGCNVTAISNILNVQVADSLLPGVISIFEDLVCFGSTPLQMSIQGNTGGYSPYSFNWERRIGLVGAWNTVSTVGSTYQEMDSALEDTYYRVSTISDQGCGTVTTPVQKIRVNELPGEDHWSIVGASLVCSEASGLRYQISNDYNTGTIDWQFNSGVLSSNTLSKVFVDFNSVSTTTLDTMTVVLTSNRTGCKRTIEKQIEISEMASPNECQIVQKTGTNILICSDTTQGVKYHWGYFVKSTGAMVLINSANGRYHNFGGPLDTTNLVYFVRTAYASCYTFSYFNASSNPLSLDAFDGEFKVFPNPASHQIKVEGMSQIIDIHLIDMNGRIYPLGISTEYIDIPEAVSNGVYIIRIRTNSGLVQKRLIIQRS